MAQFPNRLFNRIFPQIKFWLLILVPVIAIIVALLLSLSKTQDKDIVEVNLFDGSQLPPVREFSAEGSNQPDLNPLRVAISGVISPSRTLQSYQELLLHISKKLGRYTTLTLKPTYSEINDLIYGGHIDVAFVCSLAYVKGSEDFGLELLVAPQIRSQTVYYSYLITPQDSQSVSLEDLRGSSFAFTDPISNSGHLAPTYQLSLLGEAPVSFFDRYIYTYNHDNSIIAVANKLVDGAAVDSLVYEYLASSDPELVSKTKVIARWGPYGIPPVVVNPAIDSGLKQQMLDFFLDLHNSDEGYRILHNLEIDRFVLVSDNIYASIREMKEELGW